MRVVPCHLVLYEPEIPPNTGNIIRLAANTGAQLHLIRPFGFEWDDARLKRAGLDYHELANVTLHDRLADFFATVQPPRTLAFTTKGAARYDSIGFETGDALLFGPETRGLPDDVLAGFEATHRLRIPMMPDSRSLNLANAVSVVVYEVLRQQGFAGLS